MPKSVVKGVVDGRKRIRVSVSECNARDGKPGSLEDCSLALGMKENYPIEHILVGRNKTFIKWQGRQNYERYNTGSAARTELIVLDRGGQFAPGEYEFKPISKSERRSRGKAHSYCGKKRGDKNNARSHRRVPGVREYTSSLLQLAPRKKKAA